MTTLADFRPLPWQAAALDGMLHGRASAFAWRGGVGSGKSLTACVALASLAYTFPGSEWILGMDTHPRLELVHLPLLRALRLRASYKAADRVFEFENGSVLRLKHLEFAGDPAAGGSPLEGGNLDGIVLDECQVVDKRYLKVALMRTRKRRTVTARDGRTVEFPPLIALSGLPIGDWWTPAVRAMGGMTWVPRTSDNARHLDPAYIERVKAGLTERERRAFLDGEELQPEGQVLYGYSSRDYPEGNVLRGHVIDWRTTRTMLAGDLGHRSPAFLLMAEVFPGVWCVVREWAPDRTTLPDLCDILRRDVCPRRDWSPGCGRLPVDELVVDPAGEAVSDQTGHSDLELLARPSGLGMWPMVEPQGPRRSIVGGLQRMNLSLEQRLLLVSGRVVDAGLAAPEDHRTLIRCIQGYRWDPRNPAKPKKDDRHDHHIDAWRYGWRRVLWDAMPVDPLEGRRPSVVEPMRPIETLAAARDER